MDPTWIHLVFDLTVPKKQATVYVPIEIWAQVEDLKGYFGDSPSEVITYGLRTWLATNEQEIQQQKIRIDALKDRIEQLKTPESSDE